MPGLQQISAQASANGKYQYIPEVPWMLLKGKFGTFNTLTDCLYKPPHKFQVLAGHSAYPTPSRLRRYLSRANQSEWPTEKRFGFLNFPTKKQSVSATVNHQVGGSSPSRGAISNSYTYDTHRPSLRVTIRPKVTGWASAMGQSMVRDISHSDWSPWLGESQYYNALTETIIGLFKTDVIRRGVACCNIDVVGYATL